MHYRKRQTKSKSRRSRSKKGGGGLLDFFSFGSNSETATNEDNKGMLSWLFPKAPSVPDQSPQIPGRQSQPQPPVQPQPQVQGGRRRRRQQTKKYKK